MDPPPTVTKPAAISVKSSGTAVVVDVDWPDSELTGVSIVPVDIGTGVLSCVVGATCEPVHVGEGDEIITTNQPISWISR